MNPIITTERLILRNWSIEDIPSFFHMNQDKEVMRFFLNTLSEAETITLYNRIQAHFRKNGFGLYAVVDKTTKAFMGYTGFMIADFESDFTPCIEIGWKFCKKYWGQGFATEAAVACVHYGFSRLDFNQIFSFTSIYNKKSEALMKRIGMKRIGEFNHPKIAKDHYLNSHVIYKLEK